MGVTNLIFSLFHMLPSTTLRVQQRQYLLNRGQQQQQAEPQADSVLAAYSTSMASSGAHQTHLIDAPLISFAGNSDAAAAGHIYARLAALLVALLLHRRDDVLQSAVGFYGALQCTIASLRVRDNAIVALFLLLTHHPQP